jgi:hypothetical protein
MKRMLLLLPLAFAAAVSAEAPIQVYKVQSSQSHSFACGDRCKFRAAVPAGPVRLRIFRGRASELSSAARNVRFVDRGCVQYRSTIIRPQRYKDLIDLKFYFTRQWLRGEFVDGIYTFIIERDDAPAGAPPVEENKLRLSTAVVDQYFTNGINVTVRAPLHRATGSQLRAHAGGREARPARAAMMADDELAGATALEASGFQDAPVLPAEPCADVSFIGGSAPVVIRRAALE